MIMSLREVMRTRVSHFAYPKYRVGPGHVGRPLHAKIHRAHTCDLRHVDEQRRHHGI
jgi:hypothetical protein